MAIAFKQVGTGTATINVPNLTADGDLMLVFAYNAGATITVPGGWSTLWNFDWAGGATLVMAYRIASSEPASYTFTGASVSRIITYSGVASVGASSHEEYAGAAITNPSHSGITRTASDSMVVSHILGPSNPTYTPPTGFTERQDTGGLEVAERQYAGSGGATGSITFAASGARTSFGMSLVELAPSGSGAYSLTAESGSVALAGTAAGLAVGHVVAAETSSYALSGAAAGLVCGRAVAANAGAIGVSGAAAGLRATRVLAAADGAYSLTGQDVGLNYSGSNPILTAQAGAFTVTGSAAGLAYGRHVPAGPAAFVAVGSPCGLRAGRVLAAEVGLYTWTGQAADLYTQSWSPVWGMGNRYGASVGASRCAAAMAASDLSADLEESRATSSLVESRVRAGIV